MRNLLLLLLAAGAAPALLPAQSSPAPLRYGKWIALAGSIGLNLAAASAHREADRVFELLTARCGDDAALCDVSGDGVYTDPESESLYQETVRLDRKTRSLLFGGEAALLGAAVLFVWEFARPKAPPENIPFAPRVNFNAGSTDIGVRVPW